MGDDENPKVVRRARNYRLLLLSSLPKWPKMSGLVRADTKKEKSFSHDPQGGREKEGFGHVKADMSNEKRSSDGSNYTSTGSVKNVMSA